MTKKKYIPEFQLRIEPKYLDEAIIQLKGMGIHGSYHDAPRVSPFDDREIVIMPGEFMGKSLEGKLSPKLRNYIISNLDIPIIF